MTVRRVNLPDNSPGPLSGWKLVVAVAVLAIVIITSLWLTGSERAAVYVTFPVLAALGVISVRRD